MSMRPRRSRLHALLAGGCAPLAAEQARSRHDPARTMVHNGGTRAGIGAVYSRAKGRLEPTGLRGTASAAFAETH